MPQAGTSTDQMLVPWLLTWGGIVGVLLGFLLTVSAVGEYRRLVAGRFPRPGFLIARRVCGVVTGARGRTRQMLIGRKVWLSWDIRWVTSGETLALILEQSDALDLDLERPIEIAGEEAIRRVRFVPGKVGHAAYGRASVRGRLYSSRREGPIASAQVVVYPATD